MYKKRICLTTFLIIAVTVLLLLFYNLLFGKLIPWFPLKPGFDKIFISRASIYFPKNNASPDCIEKVDEIIKEVEKSHGIMFKTKVRIFCLSSKKEFSKYAPISIEASQSINTGTVIYIPLNTKEKLSSLEEMIMHELSHAILFQNTTFLNAFRIPDWLREGIANYYGTRSWNYEPEQFKKLAGEGLLFDPIEKMDDLYSKRRKGQFIHSEYRYFVEYIIHNYGGDKKMMQFTRELIKNPLEEKMIFQEIFDIRLENVAENFKNDVLAKKWPR